jgi:hypothetical protein
VMPNDKLTCGCGREIPVLALWTALSVRARLKCSACGCQITYEFMVQRAEESEYAKAVIVAYYLLVRFRWVSVDAIENAGVQLDPKVVGGIFTGLQRAGLIHRIGGVPKAVHLLVEPEPKVMFEPGPRFPAPQAAFANSIRRAQPAPTPMRRADIAAFRTN